MCTVSYQSNGRSFILTSSRDEHLTRARAFTPQWYSFSSGKIFFPKDATGNGTWMAYHENGQVMVLLNGGFVNHRSAPPYRKSRGLVFLEIFDCADPQNGFHQAELNNIEPFTLVIRTNEELFEARWDGQLKTVTALNPFQSYIWSSVTLYTNETIKEREEWFRAFIQAKPLLDPDQLIDFHRFAGNGNIENSILMKRGHELTTVSITQFSKLDQSSIFRYYDLLLEQAFESGFTYNLMLNN